MAARVLGSLPNFLRLDSDALALTSSVYIHVVADDASLQRLGGPSDYAPFLPESDDDVVGYEARHMIGQKVTGKRERLFVTSVVPSRTLVWEGRRWQTTAEPPPLPPGDLVEGAAAEGAARGAMGTRLPSGYSWGARLRLGDGRVALLGESPSRHDVVFVASASRESGVLTTPRPPREAEGPLDHHKCRFLEAADERAYVTCDGYDARRERRFESIQRLDGSEWVELVTPPAERDDNRSAYAVDAEGGLWFWTTARTSSVVRVGADGQIDRIELPRASADLARPYYSATDVVSTRGRGDDRPYRLWTVGTLAPAKAPELPHFVGQIVARRSGDVWVTALELGQSALVYRIARDGAAPKPILITSPADQQNEVRNARPPRSWAGGHCPQLFVTLASASLGADLATERVETRLGEIDALLSKLNRRLYTRAVVVGRLAERRVVGVLLMRSSPDAGEDIMEAAATRLVERFTTDPASPPPVHCSVPVLDRIIEG